MQAAADTKDFMEKSIVKESGSIFWWVLGFPPLVNFFLYRNWRMLGERMKARMQVLGFLIGVFVISSWTVSGEKYWGGVYIAYLLVWFGWSFVSFESYLSDRLGNRYRVVNDGKILHYFVVVILAIFIQFLMNGVQFMVRSEMGGGLSAEMEKFNKEYEAKNEAGAREDLLKGVSGVWALSASNQALEIHFEEDRKWIKLGGESSWVTIKHVDLENDLVVFLMEGEDALHTLGVWRGNDGSFNLRIAFAGQGWVPLNWVRRNL